MTLREAERRRASHEAEQQRRQAQREAAQAERDRAIDDQRVMTLRQCAEVNGISIWTLRRLIKAGNGPAITGLSPRRIGVTVGNNRKWQASRERA